jgi:hypothetical protein
MKGTKNINFYRQIACHNPEGRGKKNINICNMNISFVKVAKIQSGRGSVKNLTKKGYRVGPVVAENSEYLANLSQCTVAGMLVISSQKYRNEEVHAVNLQDKK